LNAWTHRRKSRNAVKLRPREPVCWLTILDFYPATQLPQPMHTTAPNHTHTHAQANYTYELSSSLSELDLFGLLASTSSSDFSALDSFTLRFFA
jgi:hypothetical protein